MSHGLLLCVITFRSRGTMPSARTALVHASLKTKDRCGGVCVFRYARDTPDPIKELAHAGSAMVPPPLIATARQPQGLDGSPVNIAPPRIR
ncbi:hypothetical protein [Actinomadura miaoliensis]|uniref:hypothetical protein n=1 Tax=Actinomadura miaoliensis TaxID=430685 RepID=UPI0031EA01F6